MKTLILTNLFLICALVSSAQKTKDTKVTVAVSDTANLFAKVTRSLYEQGYTITLKDEQAKFIDTDWRQLKKTAGKVKTRILFIDNTIQFSSKYKLAFESAFGEMEMDISNNGSKGSDVKIYWEELVRLAKLFGGNVSYSK